MVLQIAPVMIHPRGEAVSERRAAAKALLRWSATKREARLDAVINDPLLPGRILPSDYLGQQERWPPAKADGGCKCSSLRSQLRLGRPGRQPATTHVQTRIVALQTFVAYATKVRHWRGRRR